MDVFLKDSLKTLEEILRNLSVFAVAFSGGADSTFLLAAAKKAGPERLLAITVSSQFFSSGEIDFAEKMAKSIGVEHIRMDLDIMKFEDVVRNSSQRCYFCKQHVFSVIKKKACQKGIENLLHGVNLDDLHDFRPGLKSAGELGFLSPLAEAGFTKEDVRICSRHMGLETWNMPSQSCLATRIPYGDRITAEKLEMIDKGESLLKDMGFVNIRVRFHRGMARIETDARSIEDVADRDARKRIVQGFKKIGFGYTSLDLEGYKTGNMNIEVD